MTAGWFPALTCLLPLGAMIRSDFRRRRIGVVPLSLFGAAALVSAWICFGGTAVVRRLAEGGIFLGLLYAFLWLYCVVRRRRRAIGTGDLLFFPLLAPFFELYDFVFFLTGSFAVSLLFHWIASRLEKQKTRSVPLVGTVGVCFGVYLLVWIL